MIFVTVGTHEQQFNRLIKYIDLLKQNQIINHSVLMQTGYSDYEPVACQWKAFFPYTEMQKYMELADIIITHGGPSSFLKPLELGKIPIVVPRRLQYEEHVNDHQVEFVNKVSTINKNIIPVLELNDLKDIILNYPQHISNIKSDNITNNENFNKSLEAIAASFFTKK